MTGGVHPDCPFIIHGAACEVCFLLERIECIPGNGIAFVLISLCACVIGPKVSINYGPTVHGVALGRYHNITGHRNGFQLHLQ